MKCTSVNWPFSGSNIAPPLISANELQCVGTRASIFHLGVGLCSRYTKKNG